MMNISDLDTAAQNVAWRARELEKDVAKFVAYSEAFMASGEYLNIVSLCEKMDSRVTFWGDRKTPPYLVFSGHTHPETLFFSSEGGRPSEWLTLEQVARLWFKIFSRGELSTEEVAKAFWKKLAERADAEAYNFRFENDGQFNQSEMARFSAENRAAEAQMFRRWLYWLCKWAGIILVLVSAASFTFAMSG
jgi:hypothetical protein